MIEYRSLISPLCKVPGETKNSTARDMSRTREYLNSREMGLKIYDAEPWISRVKIRSCIW